MGRTCVWRCWIVVCVLAGVYWGCDRRVATVPQTEENHALIEWEEEPRERVDRAIGDSLRWVGIEAPLRWEAGHEVQIRLFWEVTQDFSGDRPDDTGDARLVLSTSERGPKQIVAKILSDRVPRGQATKGESPADKGTSKGKGGRGYVKGDRLIQEIGFFVSPRLFAGDVVLSIQKEDGERGAILESGSGLSGASREQIKTNSYLANIHSLFARYLELRKPLKRLAFRRQGFVGDGKPEESQWEDASGFAFVPLTEGAAQRSSLSLFLESDSLFIGGTFEDSDLIVGKTREGSDYVGIDFQLGDEKTAVRLVIRPDNTYEMIRLMDPEGPKVELNGELVVSVDGTINESEDRDGGWSFEFQFLYSQLPGYHASLQEEGAIWRVNGFRHLVNRGKPSGNQSWNVLAEEDRYVERGFAEMPMNRGTFAQVIVVKGGEVDE